MEKNKETPTAVTDGVAELEEYSLENGYSECTVHIGNDGKLRLVSKD